MSPTPDPAAFGLTGDDLRTAGRMARAELAWRAADKGDVLEWGRILFPEKFPKPFCKEMHGYFVDIADEPFTATEAPRGHGKTLIKCFLLPIFKALNYPEAYGYYLNVQATEDKALAVNRAVKEELERNEVLREMYGDQVGERWTDGEMELANGVVFKAIGAGQSIRGLNYKNRRPDYFVVDDLYNDEDIHNQESTEKKNEWVMSALYPARAHHRRTSFHLQGTAINLWDLLHTLKAAPGVRSCTFKAVLDWETRKVLWPELHTFEDVLREKEIMLAQGKGSVIWFREYQNERHDDARAVIKRGWLYPEGKPSWERGTEELKIDGYAVKILEVRLGNDPSVGEKQENDYTGFVLVWKFRHTDSARALYFINAVWNEHLSQNERILLADRICKEQPTERAVNRIYAEGIAGFKDYVAELRRRVSVPVTEIDRVKDKISNLEAKSSLFENGQVFLNKAIDPRLKDMLVYQLTTNRPNHDDLRDALFLALDAATTPWTWA